MTQRRTLPHPIGRGRRLLLAALVAIGIGQALGGIGLAVTVQHAFDALVAPHTTSSTTPHVLVAALLAAVGVTALCRGLERSTAERLGQRYVMHVRELLFEHLTTVPARSLARRSSGALLMRFVGDLSALRTWVSLGIARLVVAGVSVTLITIGLATMHPVLALAVSGVLVAGAVAMIAAGRRLVTTSRRARHRRARLTGEVAERLTNVGAVQASGQVARERRRVGRRSSALADAMVRKAGAAGTARGIAEAASGLATVTLLLVGAVAVQRGDVTAGTIVGALTVVGLMSTSLRDLGRVSEYAAGAKVGREAAERFLALEPMPDEGTTPLPAGGGSIELADVHVGTAVRGVTATAEAGAVVALVGPNGAGKSTLAGLVARLVDPDVGKVRLDGVPLPDVPLASLRREVGIVSPDLPLMRGSIRRNVRYRHPRASDAQVDEVARASGLHAVLDALDDGWDADVGEGGRLLSSGQRTRVALARALLGEPRLLVLDEADAHLDAETTALVEAAVAARTGTTIVISHRATMVRGASVVWHVDDGRLVEHGHPAALLEADGPTARLLARTPDPARIGEAWAHVEHGGERSAACSTRPTPAAR